MRIAQEKPTDHRDRLLQQTSRHGPAEMVRDAAGTSERWIDYPGLVRKMFMRAPDTLATKGIYLWETLEHAVRATTPPGWNAPRPIGATARRWNAMTAFSSWKTRAGT